MKFTEIFWIENAENTDDGASGDQRELSCPVCGAGWLNVNMEEGEFSESECEHMMFHWYQDGDPVATHVAEDIFEKALREALKKTDPESRANTSAELFHDIHHQRLDKKFWDAFECHGIDEIVFGDDEGNTFIFGLSRNVTTY